MIDETRREELKQKIAVLELEQRILDEQPRGEAAVLVSVIQRNRLLDLGGTDEWYSLLGLVTLATGVIGFDNNGQPIRDENQIIPEVQRMLVGNRLFQRIANECLAKEFDGAILDFSHVNALFPPASDNQQIIDKPNRTHADQP